MGRLPWPTSRQLFRRPLRRRSHNLCKQTVPLLHYLHSTEVLLVVYKEPPVFQFVLITFFFLALGATEKSLAISSFASSSQVFVDIDKISLSLLSSRLSSPSSLSLSSEKTNPTPFTVLKESSVWKTMSLLYWEAQNRAQYSRCRLTNAK